VARSTRSRKLLDDVTRSTISAWIVDAAPCPDSPSPGDRWKKRWRGCGDGGACRKDSRCGVLTVPDLGTLACQTSSVSLLEPKGGFEIRFVITGRFRQSSGNAACERVEVGENQGSSIIELSHPGGSRRVFAAMSLYMDASGWFCR